MTKERDRQKNLWNLLSHIIWCILREIHQITTYCKSAEDQIKIHVHSALVRCRFVCLIDCLFFPPVYFHYFSSLPCLLLFVLPVRKFCNCLSLTTTTFSFFFFNSSVLFFQRFCSLFICSNFIFAVMYLPIDVLHAVFQTFPEQLSLG